MKNFFDVHQLVLLAAQIDGPLPVLTRSNRDRRASSRNQTGLPVQAAGGGTPFTIVSSITTSLRALIPCSRYGGM